MKFIITNEGERCECPVCGQLLFHTKPENGWALDEVPEWSRDMLCRHVRLLHFP